MIIALYNGNPTNKLYTSNAWSLLTIKMYYIYLPYGKVMLCLVHEIVAMTAK